VEVASSILVNRSHGVLGQLAEPPGPDPGLSGFESQGRHAWRVNQAGAWASLLPSAWLRPWRSSRPLSAAGWLTEREGARPETGGQGEEPCAGPTPGWLTRPGPMTARGPWRRSSARSRAPGPYPGGRWFESTRRYQHLECMERPVGVVVISPRSQRGDAGSIPARGTQAQPPSSTG
jgi:hypothetical protein